MHTLTTWGYLRNPLVSANGSQVIVLEVNSHLRFWRISLEGSATLTGSEGTGEVIVTGASPDCSMIGLAGYYLPVVRSSTIPSSTVGELLATQGAITPFAGTITSLVGTSESNRVFAGLAGLPSSDGTVYPRIWTVYLDRNCPGELNFNAQVDDEDFALFSAAYDAYFCPDPELDGPCTAAFNQDGFADDADFNIFATSYDNLVCP